PCRGDRAGRVRPVLSQRMGDARGWATGAVSLPHRHEPRHLAVAARKALAAADAVSDGARATSRTAGRPRADDGRDSEAGLRRAGAAAAEVPRAAGAL